MVGCWERAFSQLFLLCKFAATKDKGSVILASDFLEYLLAAANWPADLSSSPAYFGFLQYLSKRAAQGNTYKRAHSEFPEDVFRHMAFKSRSKIAFGTSHFRLA